MSGITIRVDTKLVEKVLADAQRQVPFAVAAAINDIAFQTQRAENAAMSQVFKHPRPFTQRSVAVDKATKVSLTATVRIKDAQAKYLAPYEAGGVHELPGQALLNPKNVSLDGFGQLRKGQFKALAAKPGDFVGTVNGVSGLWRRPAPATKTVRRKAAKTGQPAPRGKLTLLVRFGEALPVKQHLDFAKRAAAVVAAALPAAMSAAIVKALATMKP